MKTILSSILCALLAVVLMVACSTKPATSSTNKPPAPEPKPSWVDNRPVNGSYYIGIGSANKKSQPLDFQNIAKKNALNDLATEISVRVQGSTFLNTLEVNKNFSEEFISTISTTSDEKIEDFEVVGVWENENEYWIFYRLNKAQYQAKKREKKNMALSVANDYYVKGKDAENLGNVPAAIDLYLRGLFAIKDYWNEVNEFDQNGNKVFLDNQIYSDLQKMCSGLVIKPSQQKIVLGAENNYVASTGFNVVYKDLPVKGISTLHQFPRTRFARPRSIVSDEKGYVAVLVQDINSSEKNPELTIEIDLTPLQPVDLDRKITEGIMGNLKTEVRKVPIEFIPPTFAVQATELQYGTAATSSVLSTALQSEMVKKGLRLTQTANADYIVKINADTREGGEAQGFTVAYLDMNVIVTDKAGNIVYKEGANNIKGLQLNKAAAGMEAYKKGQERLEDQIVPSIIESIF